MTVTHAYGHGDSWLANNMLKLATRSDVHAETTVRGLMAMPLSDD
jgi:hypothetical protein